MLKNYFSLVTSELMSRVVSFFWVVYMARHLGVADYGRYSTVMATISIATSFLDLGVSYIIIREIVKDKTLTPRYLGAQIYLRSIIGLTALIIIGFSINWSGVNHNMKILLFLAGLHMLFHNVGTIGDTIFSAYNKQYLSAIMHTLHNIGWAILGCLALKTTGSLRSLLVAMAANSTVICLIYLWLVFKKFAIPDFRIPVGFITRLVRISFPIGLTGIFGTAFSRIDRLLLSSYCGAYDVGLYSAAMTLIGPVAELTWSSAIIVLYPHMAKLHQDIKKFEFVFKNVITWLFTAILGCVTVFICFPDQIIKFAFGKKYEQSAHILGLLALQLLAQPFHGVLGRILMIQDKQNLYSLAYFTAFVTNLLLNLVFIHKWGIFGAAISSVITYSLLSVYFSVFGSVSIRKYFDGEKILQAILIALTSGFVVKNVLSLNLFLSLFVFSLLYLALTVSLMDIRSNWTKTVQMLD